jgi:hypothetical protein
MPSETRLPAVPNLKEFRDTRLWFQYAMGGIAGAGLVGTITLFRKASEGPQLLVAAGTVFAATLIALGVVYLKFGAPVVLRQTASGVERICGANVQRIPYDELFGFRSKWTDVLRNGIYHHTQVRLEFSSERPDLPVLKYDSTVDYDTLKYNELREFQDEVAEIVARRMADVLYNEGSVAWTHKLNLRHDGLELMKKSGGAPELIGFDRISDWTVDEGLFKLGIDGNRRPLLVEDTSQWNFYPGLLLFRQLCASPSDGASIDQSEPALID